MATEAWRGANLRDGPIAFEATTVSGKHDLTAFIGHNVLMHGEQAPPTTKATRKTDALVLCCMSHQFFNEPLNKLKFRPVRMTSQLMDPGSFLLHDIL